MAILAAISGCGGARGLPVIDVTGTDFGLVAPDSASPGPTRFHFTRGGTVAHEVAIARVKLGVRIERLLDTERKGGEVEGLDDPGGRSHAMLGMVRPPHGRTR